MTTTISNIHADTPEANYPYSATPKSFPNCETESRELLNQNIMLISLLNNSSVKGIYRVQVKAQVLTNEVRLKELQLEVEKVSINSPSKQNKL